MPAETGYDIAIVIINRHEPEGETATRLLEIAQEKGYSPRVVEAKRGEHDAGLSFRVPEDVAEAFNAERGDRWSKDDVLVNQYDPDKIENDGEKDETGEDTAETTPADVTTDDDDTTLVDDDNDPITPPVRRSRSGK